MTIDDLPPIFFTEIGELAAALERAEKHAVIYEEDMTVRLPSKEIAEALRLAKKLRARVLAGLADQPMDP